MTWTGKPFWPLAVYALVVIILVAAVLVLSYLLGPRHKGRATAEPYESGIVPTGSARVRLGVKFYLVALFFVIFDLEAVFIIAWAIAARELGWVGYLEIFIFIVILFVALFYLWRLRALDFGPTGRLNPRERGGALIGRSGDEEEGERRAGDEGLQCLVHSTGGNSVRGP